MTYEEVANVCFRILDILDEHKLEVPHGVNADIRSQVFTLMNKVYQAKQEQAEEIRGLQMLQEYLERMLLE